MNAPAPLLEHSLVDELPGMYARVEPHAYPSPELVLLNEGLAMELGLDPRRLADEGARWFGGHARVPGSEPVAVAYAGHQFGHLNPQLGDGRAVLLGMPAKPARTFVGEPSGVQ
ncbi:MAG: protein adenylyltransferase SelO family protein, partial [Myxococcota bacterium]